MYQIEEYRKKQHLTIGELAERVGISREYMSQIENNRVSNIGTKLLVKLAKVLEVSVTDILFLE